MNRRRFLQLTGATGLATGIGSTTALGYIPEHNWEKYDWGAGPEVKDRLYQGPFPQYGPGAVVPTVMLSWSRRRRKTLFPTTVWG